MFRPLKGLVSKNWTFGKWQRAGHVSTDGLYQHRDQYGDTDDKVDIDECEMNSAGEEEDSCDEEVEF